MSTVDTKCIISESECTNHRFRVWLQRFGLHLDIYLIIYKTSLQYSSSFILAECKEDLNNGKAKNNEYLSGKNIPQKHM